MRKDLRRENEEEGRRLDPRGWEGGTWPELQMRNLAHSFLDGDESVVAVAIITTVELALLGVVLFITWHDTR